MTSNKQKTIHKAGGISQSTGTPRNIPMTTKAKWPEVSFELLQMNAATIKIY